ncbi:hypothetical protein A2U01_0119517, partial [Trifolium medium]|nr:hypothetical protein [Trifolium medium]
MQQRNTSANPWLQAVSWIPLPSDTLKCNIGCCDLLVRAE